MAVKSSRGFVYLLIDDINGSQKEQFGVSCSVVFLCLCVPIQFCSILISVHLDISNFLDNSILTVCISDVSYLLNPVLLLFLVPGINFILFVS